MPAYPESMFHPAAECIACADCGRCLACQGCEPQCASWQRGTWRKGSAPTLAGYYQVRDADGPYVAPIFLWAADPNAPNYIGWGFDAQDDPEGIGLSWDADTFEWFERGA